jgi:mannose-6-phosphate isomerase-like protein (cupin superfamily)
LCAELVLPPDASIGLHEHAGEDEVYIVQQGSGIINVDGKETEVESGDAILTGRGASHSIKNTGNKDLVITAVIMLYPNA